MKFKLFLLTLICSISSYSQCFDCGHSIGGHVEDYVVDIDKASDGIILTTNPNQGWGRSIYKYDFNCNLIWTNTFMPDNSNPADSMGFIDTTVDNNDNVYAIIRNNRGGIIVDGFAIEMGVSIIKLNADGAIEWVKKISYNYYLKRKIHYSMGYIYVVGQFEGINTDIGLTVPNGFGSQYFIAKFDTMGNLNNAKQYGASGNEEYFDSQIDSNGNIYFIGAQVSASTARPYLMKADSNLNLLWSKELTNYLNWSFTPLTLYYNNSNEELYIWSKYYKSTSDIGNCSVGSVVMEVSKDTGTLKNHIIIDNCGFLVPVGNGIGDVEQRSFMTHEGSNLYVLSSFRGAITIGNQTLNTTKTIYNDDNSDLILYKIDLTNFSSELILRSEGINYADSSPYRDLAGPIVAFNNSVYITSSFMSYPITINGNTIVNNSGNNSRDILFYKHNLDQANTDNLISYNKSCFSDTTEFIINGDFDSVLWNFNDPASGINNSSGLINPTHIFTSLGLYNVSAVVTCGAETETVNLAVTISGNPSVNSVVNLYGCEDTYGSQISSSFNTASIANDLIGNQSNLAIQYFDQNGNELPSPLPNPMSNTVLAQETITARVFYIDNPTCYTEVSFDLIAKPVPEIFEVEDIYECDINNDGFTQFDLTNIENTLIGNQPDLSLQFYDSDNNLIPTSSLSNYTNVNQNEDYIIVRAIINTNACYSEAIIKLIANPLPIANLLSEIIGCDDNNDGISEYFDTSTLETEVLNGQTGMVVSYFNEFGNQLASPLPNPYTNTKANQETITVRVTYPQTGCYAETFLKLITSAKPLINQPATLYACDNGNGIALFNTSTIEHQLLGNQTGLLIFYSDENGMALPSPLPANYQNTKAWSQKINVRVENELNPLCYSETSFNLTVNELPQINLESDYFLCDLEPSFYIAADSNFDSWKWTFEDGSVISNSFEANLTDAGSYTLQITKINHGISCENEFSFNLVRSILPIIDEVKIQDISANNSIEIITAGDGDFEYSIDGFNYQDDNIFQNLSGGIYSVQVRDKKGCGLDDEEVVLVDYPKFFTPNNDGFNDYWQIKGIEKFPDAVIYIFDRFGKLLKQLTFNDLGWDGTFNGKSLFASDYWFTADLGDGRTFKGHFSLKR